MNKSTLETYISQGLSTHQIAKIANKSQTNVRYWLNKFNLSTTNKSFSEGYSLKEKIIENDIEYKICPKCQQKKELIKEFYIKENKCAHSWCKSCSNQNTIATQQKLKKQSVQYKGGKCVKCGYNKYDGALDFHHLDPSKKDFSISRRKNCSLETLKTELDKCILICRNCHAELHFDERCKRTI
jgi:hypothetical protein